MSKCASEGCALDSRGCVSLDKILRSFGAPISEEQAWALCYAFSECYIKLCGRRRRKLNLVSNLRHVILHKDGYIDDETFLPSAENGKGRQKVSTEGKLVADLGVVLYRALEYNLRSDEERELSPALDKLIDHMTSAEPEKGETDDEGIERDSGDSGDEHHIETTFTMREALTMCENRLVSEGATEGVDEHYKAVVRALIAEAVDLTSFLKKVAEGARLVARQEDLLSSEQDLYQLQCEDWAVLWKQVMKQLRDGVKLKKVDYTKTSLEYALTPYEMLMEDIRSRRYTLKQVMVNGDIPPRLKKDAHTIILDFIRSRPPLKKASERKLAPMRKVSSPMELLMDSIKKNDNRRLKPVKTPSRARPMSMVETSTMRIVPSPQPKKKLISAPRLNLSAEDEDDDDLSDIPPSSPRPSSPSIFGGPLSNTTHTHASLTTSPATPASPISVASETSATSPLSRVAYDLATYGGGGKAPERRHSISICETPGGEAPPSSNSSGSGTPQNVSGMSSRRNTPPGTPQHQMLASTSQIQRDFLSSAHFSSRLDCLALTLEEVVHIRNVLTKADLEALPLDLSIKEDVAKGKICFLCMKTRFGFFGPRGRECRLCKRMVCKKCVTKMRIPTEHFSNIPVIMLTPQALSPKEEDEDHTSLPRTFLNMLQDFPRGNSVERRSSITGSVGSAPSSPSTPRSFFGGPSSLQGRHIAPCVTQDIQKKQEIRQRNVEMCERLRGELMAVCLDCKAMVIHVLLSIKLRRDHPDSVLAGSSSSGGGGAVPTSVTPSSDSLSRGHLHLNLTPVYN